MGKTTSIEMTHGDSFSDIRNKMFKKDGLNKETSRVLTIFGWVLLVTSYACLIPGLILTMYYYEVQGLRMDKTLMTTLELVDATGGKFAAGLLAFFALVIPGVKLLLMVVGHIFNKPVLSRMVLLISKWAVVDAIAASFVMAYFTNAYKGSIISKVDVGFSCFVVYCIFSTVGALIIDSQDIPFSEMYARRRFWVVHDDLIASKMSSYVMLAVSCALTVASMFITTVEMGLTGDSVSMSIVSACHRLATEVNSDIRCMFLIVPFLLVVPLLEILFLLSMLYKPVDTTFNRCLLRSLPHLGLLDVYAVSVIVMFIFLNKMGQVKVTIPAVGFIVLWMGVVCMYATRFFVNRHLSLVLGASEEKIERDHSNLNGGGISTVSSVELCCDPTSKMQQNDSV